MYVCVGGWGRACACGGGGGGGWGWVCVLKLVKVVNIGLMSQQNITAAELTMCVRGGISWLLGQIIYII